MEALTGFLTNPALALAGLALGTVPIVIHLLNRTFYDRQHWAAMDFLLRAERKTRRRVRMENLLLLILRYLLLALLGIALAQPFLNEPALAVLGEQKKHLVVVLDQSYSMRATKPGSGATAYDEAREEVVRILNNRFRPASGDRVTILASSAFPEELIGTPSQDRSHAIRLVKESSPTFFQGNLLESLDLLDSNLEDTPGNMNQHVVWVTDLQANTWVPNDERKRDRVRQELDRINENLNEFVLVDVGRNETDNLGVVELKAKDQFPVRNRPIHLTTRVKNFLESSKTTTVSLFKDERNVETVDVDVQPGSTAEKTFDPIRFEEVGSHSVHAELSNDLLAADNSRFRAMNIDEKINVLAVDGEPGEQSDTRSETYFLKSSLDPGEGSTPYDINVVTDYMFRDETLEDYDLIVLANLSSLSAERRDKLRQFMKRGGGVLMFFGDQTTLKTFNDTLYNIDNPLLPGELQEIHSQSPGEGNFVRLDDVNLDHPALSFFQPYPDKLTSLMTHGWVRMNIPEDALNVRVLARFNDEHRAPAIAERSIGRGKLVTIQTSADMDWNYWPNFQGYVLLVDQLSRYLLRQKEQSLNVRVGDQINFPVSVFDSSKNFRIVSPDDRVSVKSARPLRAGGYVVRLNNMNRPGIYSIEKENENESGDWTLDRVVSANTVSGEGNLKPVSHRKMKSEYPDLSFRSFADTREQTGERQQTDLWKLFAGLVLLFLGLESLLALRIDRKRQV